MTRLFFTADGLLREQTRGAESRALPRVVENQDGTVARLVSGDAEHEIVPSASTGWAFTLRDGDGALSGGFQPFRLRCGGRLRVGEVGISLHGRPWSHEGWAFSTPDGRRVEATARAAGKAPSPVVAGTNGAGPAQESAVVLEAAESIEELLAIAGVLTLGCWLIARWQRTPPVHHVLASAPAGTVLAGGPGEFHAAGIGARTAN